MSDDALPPPRHDIPDVDGVFALRAAALVAGCLILSCLAMAWIFPGIVITRFEPSELPQVAAPALQSSPRADLAAFHRAELQRLNSAGWIDRPAGRVHIPIADAMGRVAAEGIPGWPGAAR